MKFGVTSVGVPAEILVFESEIERYANMYAWELGWTAIPTRPGTKRPRGRWKGYQLAPPDEDQREQWKKKLWETEKTGIGVVTGPASGITVVDIDNEAADKWLRDQVDLPPTATARSQHGTHFYFETGGLKFRTLQGVQGIPGLDVRGQHGFIVAPPSRFVDGTGRYAWESDPRKVLAPMPDELAWILRPAGSGRRREFSRLTDFYKTILEGTRNDTLLRFAGHLLARGTPPEAILPLMYGLNVMHVHPPLPDAEVEIIAESILRRHVNGGTNLRAFDESQDRLIAEIHRRGRSISEIAKDTGRSRSAVGRSLERARRAASGSTTGKGQQTRRTAAKQKG